MDKHLTEIELFEFANNLIEDKIQIEAIGNHISTCKNCAVRLEEEKSFDSNLTSNLHVTHTVDVSKNIVDHFSTQQVPSMVDYTWIIYTILGLSGFLYLLQLSNISLFESIGDLPIPQVSYVNAIVSGVISILFIDLLSKYFKQKKQHISY